ncbi:MAG: 50S ribosomal protein L19 [Candidatus Moraniibacteriota bacterium]
MNNKLVEFNLNQRTTKEMPNFQTGDIVKVYRRIKEGGKERVQVFEGMIIAKKGGQSSSPMITVRKVSSGVGVELVLPIYSPSIDKIEVVKRAKVRRSKLYYIRDKSAKSLRLKYKDIAKFASVEDVKAEEVAVEAEKVAEEMPVAEVVEVQAVEAEVVEKAPKDAEK